MQRIFIAFAIIIATLSCATADRNDDAVSSEPKSIEEMRKEAWAKIDHDACREKGGDVRAEGMLGLPMCVIPYADAGEICTDGGDCEGQCRADDRVTDYEAAAGAARGICQINNSPFGCYATISNGSVDPAICVD